MLDLWLVEWLNARRWQGVVLRMAAAIMTLFLLATVAECIHDLFHLNWLTGFDHRMARSALQNMVDSSYFSATSLPRIIRNLPDRYDWYILAFVTGFGAWTLDSAVVAPIAAMLAPPRPEFLAWRGSADLLSPWSRTPQTVGRSDALAKLNEFANSGERTLRLHGVFGPRGIGRTRLAIDMMRGLRQHRWHAGQLTARIPDHWQPRRPTLILVEMDHHAQIFWESVDNLLALGRLKYPVRVLFDSAMDFELMADGQDEHRVTALRSLLHHRGRKDFEDSQRDAKTTAGTWTDKAGETEENLPAERPKPAGPPPDFLPIEPLAKGPAAELAAAAARIARRPLQKLLRRQALNPQQVEQVVQAAWGRPKYLLELARRYVRYLDQKPSPAGGMGPSSAPFPLNVVAADTATDLIRTASQAFPSDGLELCLMAAIGGEAAIESAYDMKHAALHAQARRRIAAGAGDQQKLARLFRESAAGYWREDVRGLSPAILDPLVAAEVVFKVLARLQEPDLEALAKVLFQVDPQSAEPRVYSHGLAAILAPPPTGDAPLLHERRGAAALVLAVVPTDEAAAARRAAAQWLGLQQGPAGGPLGYDAEEAIDDLAAAGRFLLSAAKALGRFELGDEGGIRNLSVGAMLRLLEMAATSKQRRSILDKLEAQLASRNVQDEIAVLARDADWLKSPNLAKVVGLVLEPETECRPLDLGWAAALYGQTPRDKALTDPERVAQAQRAMEIMDVAFLADPGEANWSSKDLELICGLLAGGDQIGRMMAAWAAYWLVRPYRLEDPGRVDPSLVDCLVQAANDAGLEAHTWKRVAASVAKISLGPAPEDLLSDLLEWGDSLVGLKGPLPPPPQPPPTARAVQPSRVGPALRRASRVMGRARANRDLRTAAALLTLAYQPNNRQAVQVIQEDALDPFSSRQHGSDIVVRLWQAAARELPGSHAAHALVSIIHQQDSRLVVHAFLALCALGEAHLLERSDLEGEQFGDLFLDTWAVVQSRKPLDTNLVVAPGRVESAARVIPVRGSPRRAHLLKARDGRGRLGCFVILVRPEREAAYQAAIRAGAPFDLEDFGVVLASSYGENPSPAVLDQVNRRFGIVL